MTETNPAAPTVVITGATSGIGAVAAETLASRGARIIFTARDLSRGQATLDRLRAIAPQADHRVHYADLSSIAQMKRVALEIADIGMRIDVMINNAGMIINRRTLTEDGLELSFATNHLSYFVLTCLLRERFAAHARIVSTASALHLRAALDFDDLQLENSFSGMRAYANSKLCNILFTRELAKRLRGTTITANCFHPGFVATRFGSGSGGPFGALLRLGKYFASTPKAGAQTMIYLALAPEVAGLSGKYFANCAPLEPSPAASDDACAARLWDESVKLTGVDWPA
ncbi:MAG: SDR family oxidoreductase [Steroidobacteraceae bacterium]|jgi:NAD(P)-dependent dehydrogenase (short-subunit alcohol dehydrogenase family)